MSRSLLNTLILYAWKFGRLGESDCVEDEMKKIEFQINNESIIFSLKL